MQRRIFVGAAGAAAVTSFGIIGRAQAQAITLGQDEATSLIYGMPRVAYERGAVMYQVALPSMADAILDVCSELKSAANQ